MIPGIELPTLWWWQSFTFHSDSLCTNWNYCPNSFVPNARNCWIYGRI